jgi:hypothetical protein
VDAPVSRQEAAAPILSTPKGGPLVLTLRVPRPATRFVAMATVGLIGLTALVAPSIAPIRHFSNELFWNLNGCPSVWAGVPEAVSRGWSQALDGTTTASYTLPDGQTVSIPIACYDRDVHRPEP